MKISVLGAGEVEDGTPVIVENVWSILFSNSPNHL